MVGTLKARVGTQWVPIVGTAHDEVWTSNTPPDPAGIFEIWVDTSTDPVVLRYKNAIGEWVAITGTTPEPPLDEVWVGVGPPDPVGTYELWYDTAATPPILKVKLPSGSWVPVLSPNPPTAFGGVNPTLGFGQVPTDGTAQSVSRSDHYHGMPDAPAGTTFHNGASNLVPGVPSSGGTLDQASRGDHIHEIPDPVTTQLGLTVENLRPGGPDTAGTAQTASRTDHAHGLPDWGPPTPGVTFDLPTQPGTDVAFSRADHQHGTPPAPPGAVMGTVATDVNPGVTAAPGTRDENSRTDHVHGMKAYGDVVPEVTFGTLPRNGTAETFARGDHAHGVPPHPLPANGLTDQVLIKSSPTDYDAKWGYLTPTSAQISEVEITPDDPIANNPQVELWYDVNDPGTSTHEVVIQATEPTAVEHPNADLWYNPGPGQMWVKVNNLWQPYVTRGNVTPQLIPGLQPSNGTNAAFSRADHAHGTPPGGSEVEITPDDPYITDPNSQVELWVDTDAAFVTQQGVGDVWVGDNDPRTAGGEQDLWYDTSVTPGVLRVWTPGGWVNVTTESTAAPREEVIVADVEPVTVETDLWFDPTATAPLTGNVPPGGVTGNPLTKLSDVDQHVGWGNGDVLLNEDGKGYLTNGGGGLVKRVGGGIALKKQSTNVHPVVMNYDGSGATNIITADGVASMTGPLAFTTALGKKLKLYAETFGFGIESGALIAYVPTANKFAVRADLTTGTEWFAVNNTAAYYKGSVLLTQTAGDARYSRVVGGWVVVTKNAGITGNIRYRIAPGSGICTLAWTLGTPGSADICTLPAEARPAYRVGTRSSHGTDHYYSDVTIYSDGRVHTQGGTDGSVEGSVCYPVG